MDPGHNFDSLRDALLRRGWISLEQRNRQLLARSKLGIPLSQIQTLNQFNGVLDIESSESKELQQSKDEMADEDEDQVELGDLDVESQSPFNVRGYVRNHRRYWTEKNVDLKWTIWDKDLDYSKLLPHTHVNHFEKNDVLTTKAGTNSP